MSKRFFQSRGLPLTLVSLCLSLAMSSAAHSQFNPDCINTNAGPPGQNSLSSILVGCNTLKSNTGINNTAIGNQALRDNKTGINNTATGMSALIYNTTGNDNTATGIAALAGNTTGGSNTATGSGALQNNTVGSGNTAIGAGALQNNTTGPNGAVGAGNTAAGQNALNANQTGSQNAATGQNALKVNTTGANNTATGANALGANMTGGENTATGSDALANNSGGLSNTAIGTRALWQSTGSRNLAVGLLAGCNLQTGSNNIYIGNLGATSESNVIRIGATGASGNFQNCGQLAAPTATYIAGISGVDVGADGAQVYVSSSGQLGTLHSSLRFKKDVEPLGSTSEKILGLRPVSFRYKKADDNGAHPLQYGLIAEEVAKVLPDLVQYEKDGAPLSVRYHLLTPLLLGQLQRQEAENQRLAQEVVALRAQAADQAARMESLERRFTSLPRLTQADTR